MLFKRRNSASNKYFKSLLTIKNKISLGNRTFRFILKIPAIWRVIFFWKTENKSDFLQTWKMFSSRSSDAACILLSVFPEMASVPQGQRRSHQSPEHQLKVFLLMQVTQEVYWETRNTLWHTSQQDPLWPTSQNIGNKSKNKQMGPN